MIQLPYPIDIHGWKVQQHELGLGPVQLLERSVVSFRPCLVSSLFTSCKNRYADVAVQRKHVVGSEIRIWCGQLPSFRSPSSPHSLNTSPSHISRESNVVIHDIATAIIGTCSSSKYAWRSGSALRKRPRIVPRREGSGGKEPEGLAIVD